MKILLLLSGYPGNINSVKDTRNLKYDQVKFDNFYKGYFYLKKLLKNHETKVICSIWDNIGINEVKNLYKPEIFSTHKQKYFQNNFKKKYEILEKKRILKRKKWFSNLNLKDGSFVPTSRYASQLFIRQAVCRKGLKYLKKSKFNPDIIILTRFDISTRGGIPIKNPIALKNDLLDIFERNKKNPFIIIPECNQLNLGYPDMWFYFNKNALIKMQNLYDVYINSIFKKDSSYMNYLTNGWPSSELFDLKDKYDTRQFSNIILKGKNEKNLMVYPGWESPNIHMYYKYFFSLRKKPFKVFFTNKLISFLSMLRFSDYKLSLKSLLNELIIFSKIKIKIIIKNLICCIKV